MPFKEFAEHDIRVEAGRDDAEVDALGISTIPMDTNHTHIRKELIPSRSHSFSSCTSLDAGNEAKYRSRDGSREWPGITLTSVVLYTQRKAITESFRRCLHQRS
jgi:hypothetical protein